MALVNKHRGKTAREPALESAAAGRSLNELLGALGSAEAVSRRQAARELAAHPKAAPAMCGLLEDERDASVRSVIFTSLIRLKTRTVVELLAPHLRSEDAALRNAVVEALQEMPEAIEPFMQSLLSDPDSDVRISAVTILGALPHPRAPEWLSQVIRSDPHINVCAAALDCLAEVGNEESIPLLEALTHRFPDEPFISFAAAAAIRRIKGE